MARTIHAEKAYARLNPPVRMVERDGKLFDKFLFATEEDIECFEEAGYQVKYVGVDKIKKAKRIKKAAAKRSATATN